MISDYEKQRLTSMNTNNRTIMYYFALKNGELDKVQFIDTLDTISPENTVIWSSAAECATSDSIRYLCHRYQKELQDTYIYESMIKGVLFAKNLRNIDYILHTVPGPKDLSFTVISSVLQTKKHDIIEYFYHRDPFFIEKTANGDMKYLAYIRDMDVIKTIHHQHRKRFLNAINDIFMEACRGNNILLVGNILENFSLSSDDIRKGVYEAVMHKNFDILYQYCHETSIDYHLILESFFSFLSPQRTIDEWEKGMKFFSHHLDVKDFQSLIMNFASDYYRDLSEHICAYISEVGLWDMIKREPPHDHEIVRLSEIAKIRFVEQWIAAVEPMRYIDMLPWLTEHIQRLGYTDTLNDWNGIEQELLH